MIWRRAWEREGAGRSFTQALIEALNRNQQEQLKQEDIMRFARQWDHAFVSGDIRPINSGVELWNRIKSLMDESKIRESVTVLRRMIERHNGIYPEGFLNLGIAYDALGQNVKSTEALEKAVIQGDETLATEARYHLGRVLYKGRMNLPRAVDELRRATQADPGNVKAYFYLGQAIRALVDQDLLLEAEQALQTYSDGGAPLGQRDEVQKFLESRPKENQRGTR